jgi:hypothetical protein
MKELLFEGYWPFWIGGPALASLVVVVWFIEKRSLGVSGSLAAVLQKESETDKAFRAAAENDEDALADAMMQATLEEFGKEAMEAFAAEMAADENEEPGTAATVGARSPLPASVHFSFLMMLLVGGALSALASGTWSYRVTLGVVHETLTGGGVLSLLALVIGGIFVGFGTRMSGGCTTGHGLSGCSRFQPASLLATGSFFGAAVAVSFLLKALVS